MTNNTHIEVESGIPPNAVSILGDGAEEFPVLKAFQQYIDAEQNKARKRMVSLCIFFGCLMTVVIVVFLILLNGVSQRNQALNDKLFEYLIKDRDRQSSAVVVQPPADNSAVYGLTAKLEDIQKKLADAEAAEIARKEAAAKEADEIKASQKALEKAKIQEQLEIERLKAELAAEREKASLERAQTRKAEIEAYRRKYYPELYKTSPSRKTTVSTYCDEDHEIDALIEEIDDSRGDDGPVNYFEEDEKEERPLLHSKKAKKTTPTSTGYSIPVEVKGTKATWRIPRN